MRHDRHRRVAWLCLAAILGVAWLASDGHPRVVRAAEPTHAHGTLRFANLYMEVDDGPNQICGPNTFTNGTEGLLRVALKKVGGAWVDDGSWYSQDGAGFAAPCLAEPMGKGCWVIGHAGRSAGEGKLIDPADPSSWIILNVDATTGIAMLTYAPPRQKVLQWWTSIGDCSGRTGEVRYEASGGVTTGGEGAVCPGSTSAKGYLEAAGTVIDFTCFSEELGSTENKQAAFTWITRVDGRLRLDP
jgi:hypothetical protein